MYKGSYLFGNRIVTHKIRTKSTTQQARGSASFEFVGRELVRKVRRPRTDLSTLFDLGQREKVLQNELSNLYRMAQSWNESKSFAEMRMIYDGITKKERELQQLAEKIKLHQQEEPKKKEPRKITDKHYLNKTKVRDKCTAFFELEQSQKFCAFYSVSFPKGMGEDLIYKCWNAWLTNLRKTYGLTDYIWVAEYQQNGTLHYHMLCNTRMDIKKVNHAMGICLFRNGALTTTIDKYNGVDVERVGKRYTKDPIEIQKSRASLNAYITKYISKQESFIYKHAAWNCSRSVSALFTSQKIDDNISEWLQADLRLRSTECFENDFAFVEFFNLKGEDGQWYNIPDRYRAKIMYLNNKIIKLLEKEKYEKLHCNSIQSGSPSLQISERDTTRQVGGLVQLSLFGSDCNQSLRQTDKAIC